MCMIIFSVLFVYTAPGRKFDQNQKSPKCGGSEGRRGAETFPATVRHTGPGTMLRASSKGRAAAGTGFPPAGPFFPDLVPFNIIKR